jgi:hypothetical protein
MTVGMNVDPNNDCAAPSAAQLIQSGFGGVRLTARDNPANKQYITEMLAAGLEVVAVVATGDNLGYRPPEDEVILQIYNEPDLIDTAMAASDYADLFAEWRNKPGIKDNPNVRCWAAGLASGGSNATTYLRNFLVALRTNHPDTAFPDAVAIHPYTLDGLGLRTLAESCWNVTVDEAPAGIPVVATEWFQSVNPDPAVPDDAIAPFQAALNNPDPDGVCTVWNSFFGWCGNMSNLPGAVVSADGSCLPEGRRLIAAIGGDASWCDAL